MTELTTVDKNRKNIGFLFYNIYFTINHDMTIYSFFDIELTEGNLREISFLLVSIYNFSFCCQYFHQ